MLKKLTKTAPAERRRGIYFGSPLSIVSGGKCPNGFKENLLQGDSCTGKDLTELQLLLESFPSPKADPVISGEIIRQACH